MVHLCGIAPTILDKLPHESEVLSREFCNGRFRQCIVTSEFMINPRDFATVDN
jgi:hypothetical protein